MQKLRSWMNRTKRSLALLIGVGAVLLATQPVVRTAAPVTALPFSKGFLVTGGYAVGSVDFASGTSSGGFVSATINMSGVPANADILAAYLYWQTIGTDVSQVDFPKFRGQPIEVAKETKQDLVPSTAPCWSGGSSNSTYTMYNFRADVLRLLPSMVDGTGIHVLVNDTDLQANGQTLTTVMLPDSGSGNHVPLTPGAALFVVYRDRVSPLTSISVYDGISIQAPGATTTHTFAGFLGATANPTAKMTQIASSGSNNTTERIFFNNNLLATNPFTLNGGSGSDRGWNAVTYDVSSLMNLKTDSPDYGEKVTTTIDHTSSSPYECLAWSAMIFSTTVRDTDHDGLPDRLEDSSGLKSPDGNPLPDLHGMGASSQHKDLFIEMGALTADPGTSYGGDVDSTGHNHLPTPAVLKMVGDAYKNAPVANADGTSGIFVHFDVGGAYGLLGPEYASGEANQYLVPAAYARGGETAKEVDCSTIDPNCQFPGYPGTVSWKIGYQVLRDAPVGPGGEELSAAAMDACNTTMNCRRRFDQDRMNFFHYILYTHYRGKPKEPCVTGTADQQATCRATNPDFHRPSTASGISDLPGADGLVSLGAWGHHFRGSDFVQASTTLHEMGHSLWLTHGGNSSTINEPNCKPNYLSIMNYLFQLGGLRTEDGTPHLDYSSAVSGVLNENTLGGDPLNPIHLQYRTAWYAPLKPGSLPMALGSPAATRYCNGAKLPDPLPADWVPFARVDAYSATLDAIDWSAGLNAGPPQDINFDGTLESSLAGFNDWANLRLDQIGSRRNMAGFSLGIDLEFGVDVSGGEDLWGVDVSGGIDFEFGVDVSGGIDFGGDIDYSFGVDVSGGVDDPAFGVDVSGGGGDQFGVDVSGGIEMDLLLAEALGNTPANNVLACVIGTPGCNQNGDPLHRVRITWKEPDVGTPTSYSVYRVQGATVSPSSIAELVADVPGTQLSLVDQTELPDGVPFNYFVIVHFADGSASGGSNFSKIYAVNNAPQAVGENFNTNQNTPVNGAVLGNDTDGDSPASSLKAVVGTGPSHASSFTLNPDGTFNYTPAAGFGGTDQFTYRANDGTWTGPPSAPMSSDSNEVTVTITVLDATPPLVMLSIPAPNGNAGYFKTSPVGLSVTATDPSNVTSITCLDNGSPAPASYSGLGTTTALANVSIAAQGTHTIICTAIDGKGNNGAAPGSANTGALKIDSVAPTVTATAPTDNAMYVLKATVNANYSCADPAPASGMASCTGTVPSGSAINTNTVGPKSFTITGTDVAGNVTTKTINYLVVYAFTLQSFKSPANLGSSVPINWVLKDATGATINALTTMTKMESVFNGNNNICSASTVGPRATLFSPATGATGGSDFRLVSSGYAFNWNTSTANSTGKGCYTVLITLDDGSAPKIVGPIQLK